MSDRILRSLPVSRDVIDRLRQVDGANREFAQSFATLLEIPTISRVLEVGARLVTPDAARPSEDTNTRGTLSTVPTSMLHTSLRSVGGFDGIPHLGVAIITDHESDPRVTEVVLHTRPHTEEGMRFHISGIADRYGIDPDTVYEHHGSSETALRVVTNIAAGQIALRQIL